MTPNGQLCYHDLTEVLLKHNSEMSVNDLITIASPLFSDFLFMVAIYITVHLQCVFLYLRIRGNVT